MAPKVDAKAAASPTVADAKEAKTVRVPTFKTKEQLEAERIKRVRARRKKREREEAERKKREKEEEDLRISTETENKRWSDALKCLDESSPMLEANPWLIIQEPAFIHKFLDSLTDTFVSFEKHEAESVQFTAVLQKVYVVLVEVGRFARHQPAFYLSNPRTIRLFVRLLEQVAHAQADNTLLPNVLNLLLPTIAMPNLYELLAEARIVPALMGFARDEWLPLPDSFELALRIIKSLSASARLVELFVKDAGYVKLRELGLGLRAFTPQRTPEEKLNDQKTDFKPPAVKLTPAQQEIVATYLVHFPPFTPTIQPSPPAPAAVPLPAAAAAGPPIDAAAAGLTLTAGLPSAVAQTSADSKTAPASAQPAASATGAAASTVPASAAPTPAVVVTADAHAAVPAAEAVKA